MALFPQAIGQHGLHACTPRLYWRVRRNNALRVDAVTADVDVLEIAPQSAAEIFSRVAMQGGELHRKFGVYLDRVTVAQAPYEYENRLREMFPGTFQNLHLMALDPYDLALTKLERNIERDRNDVRYLARTVPFNLDLLKDRYQTELRPYLGNPKREDLTLQLWIEAINEDRSYETH